MKLKISRIAAASCLSLLILSAFLFADDPKSEFYPAKVKDISDRAYEPAVIELLDNAKESIVLSMYILKPEESGPIRLLMKDLEEALDRGVRVEIYLNTRLDPRISKKEPSEKPFKILEEKGAKIYKFTPRYRLHDKLIIVDDHYVVEGSTNWSISAIKTNYESSVLIDSSELAKVKLIRLRRFPLKGDDDGPGRPDRPKGLEPLPKDTVVGVSKELLVNKGLFPAMVTRHDDRSMDTYIFLLAEAERLGEKEFFISPEDMAVALHLPADWSITALRRQVIKFLRRLENNYHLISVNFSFGKDAWVELKQLPEGTFKVSGDFFDPKNITQKSPPAKVIFLIRAMLESEGKSIDSVNVSELAKRFGISKFSIRKGMREIGANKGQ